MQTSGVQAGALTITAIPTQNLITKLN